MVLKVVRYMAQQGYGTTSQTILTPYLGQLHLLRQELAKDNDPVLNDLDSFVLIRAGLLAPSSAAQSKRPIKISTICRSTTLFCTSFKSKPDINECKTTTRVKRVTS